MILFQILIFIISIILVSVSISGYGRIIKLNIQKNFFLDIFLGFVSLTLIITITHFFSKISILISFVLFILGIVFFFFKKKISSLKFLEFRSLYYFIIILLFIPIFLTQKYHEDFGYYHLPYALSFVEEKIIFGFANIDSSYVYNSIWLNLYSIFFFNDKNFNFLTLPSFLLFLSFILFSLYQIVQKDKKLISDYLLLISLFYFILKFTRISEFGVDLPAAIFSILTIYYFLKFSEVIFTNEKKEYFFLTSIFSIFSILIKLSTIPIILLPIFLYLKYFKYLNFDILRIRFLFVYILFFTFFVQQFIYTGCLFFPSNFTCLNVSWFSEDNINLARHIKLINKGYFSIAKDISPEEYLENFNWLSFWFKRNFIEIFEHILTMILPILFFLFSQKNKMNNNLSINDKFGLYFFLILGFLFWINYSPVYRFAIHLFITLIFVLLISNLVLRKFSNKIFFVFTIIFIFFSFTKNIIRLSKVEDIFVGIIKIDNQYILNNENSNKIRKIYKPDLKKNSVNGWQGRLCWNIPFICSYNRLDVREKNGYLVINKLIN